MIINKKKTNKIGKNYPKLVNSLYIYSQNAKNKKKTLILQL